MRYTLLVLVILAVFVTACDEGDPAAGSSPPTQQATTTTAAPTTTSEPAPTPEELADRLLAAGAGTDPAAWRALMDMSIFSELDWYWLDDFDGDGVLTFADWAQFRIALNDASGVHREWDCNTSGEDTAQCSITGTDLFYELGGNPPSPSVMEFTFQNGLFVGEKEIVGEEPAEGGAEDTWAVETERYEQWVEKTYPDRYELVFTGPCCGNWLMLPDAVPHHEELMAEYFETAG